MKQLLVNGLYFVGGLLSGGFLLYAWQTLQAREGYNVGGEILILPLFIILIGIGYQLGTEKNKSHVR